MSKGKKFICCNFENGSFENENIQENESSEKIQKQSRNPESQMADPKKIRRIN